MKRLLGALRRADEAYRLIAPGARVAVGLSGGKDSMALMRLLKIYQQFEDKRFSLGAVTVVTDPAADLSGIRAFCDELRIPLIEDINDLTTLLAAQKNPCSLCARVRRGTLLRIAKEHDFDTLALGHHSDDAVETLVMSALNEGRLHSFQPKLTAENGIAVVRPLIFAKEHDIERFVRREGIPVASLPCPYAGHTERQEIGDLLDRLEALRPGAKEKFAAALRHDYYRADEGEPQ